jgi:hypothetical protein
MPAPNAAQLPLVRALAAVLEDAVCDDPAVRAKLAARLREIIDAAPVRENTL